MISTASTSRSPGLGAGAVITCSPAATRAVTSAWSGSDDSSTGAGGSVRTDRAEGSDADTALAISSVY